jgi:hypothetical protein
LQFSSEQQELITELVEKKIKVSINKIVDIQRLENGKIVFLKQGNGFAGLQHILTHAADERKTWHLSGRNCQRGNDSHYSR